jgi:hypothetical protein
MSALERLCAQCQGKMARFEIVRIKDFNVYKKMTSVHTHTLIYFIPYTQKLNTSNCVFKVYIVIQLHAALAVYS